MIPFRLDPGEVQTFTEKGLELTFGWRLLALSSPALRVWVPPTVQAP